MAGRKNPGFLCQLKSPLNILDGTLSRWAMPAPRPLEVHGNNDGVKPLTIARFPDISEQFVFRQEQRNGKTYKKASGRLGEPGKVKTHRNQAAQKQVSEGSGDDAGHLIGNQFGAPGDARNLSLQNWSANRGGGTFHDLETYWANKLHDGTQIDVEVTDVTRPGEERPFMREVRWTEIDLNGVRTERSLTFANTHTPKSRLQQNITPP